jgi:pyruvate ferredoxin oxidoreductase delta subunit
MRIEAWENRRPVSAWLPVVDDRRYVTGISLYRFGLPDVDQALCNACGLCWIYCPEGAIRLAEDQLLFDLEDCRGCGLCAEECPRQAIRMSEERE